MPKKRSTFTNPFPVASLPEGVMKMGDKPGCEGITDAEKDRVMHVSLRITGGGVLMASDIIPSAGHKLAVGNNNYIYISPESREEADRLFNGLSAGG